jgi:hypothetical protein
MSKPQSTVVLAKTINFDQRVRAIVAVGGVSHN